ncbi:MAG: leucyl aminopeptidase [Chloroflexi bacterium]|nr:leucyl aminopeptidase [Chloroflexota bacterium]
MRRARTESEREGGQTVEIRVEAGDVTQVAAGAVVVNLFEGSSHPEGATAAVDRALDGAISRLMADDEIKGKLYEATLIHTLGKMPAARVLVMGLGKREELTQERVRGVMGEACRAMRKAGVARAATIAHGAGIGGMESQAAAQAVAEGAILGLYTFRRYLTRPYELKDMEEILVVERENNKLPALERGVEMGRIMSHATYLARDMVNEPANHMTPTHMAEAARKVAEEHGLSLTILEREQMQELGMGALLGVAQGSQQPPKLIVLEYKGGGNRTPLGLLGKGLTFDSGGISIKPSEGMQEMKEDMAGGAAVIAALGAIAQLHPPVNVTGIIPATENLPSGTAYKPGDVLKTMGGKTIEVISTDAEGRLILADALCYARRRGLSPLVDAATLTGACIVALGDICSGAFSNNQEFLSQVLKAAETAGERAWPMPMFPDYKEQNKSDVADIKNTGGRNAGAITAAQFLAEFAETTPWVHLDIAGTVRADKDKGYQVKGATGVPARTFVQLALALA